MPTYRNESKSVIKVGSKNIMPGETAESMTWHEASGLVRIADTPMFNPVILSDVISNGGIIIIPLRLSRFAIHLYAEGDTVTFKFSSEHSVPLHLYAGGRWNIRCYERTVNDVRVETSVNGRGYITLEEI
jgi:hypothetical protein